MINLNAKTLQLTPPSNRRLTMTARRLRNEDAFLFLLFFVPLVTLLLLLLLLLFVVRVRHTRWISLYTRSRPS